MNIVRAYQVVTGAWGACLVAFGAGCHAPCAPALCVDSACDVDDGPAIAPAIGQVVQVRYILPDGVELSDDVELRVETPCSCTVTTRPTAADARDPAAPALHAPSCGQGPEVVLPVTVPAGGDCLFSVTATVANDSRTIVLGAGNCTPACAPVAGCALGS